MEIVDVLPLSPVRRGGPVNSQVELLGHVTFQALPLMAPRVGPQYWLFIEQAFPHAIAIAVLGLAQSLVISRDTEQSGDKGKPMGQAKAAIDQVQRASTLTGQFRSCHRLMARLRIGLPLPSTRVHIVR